MKRSVFELEVLWGALSSELPGSYLYLRGIRGIRKISNGVFRIRYVHPGKKNIPRSKSQKEPHRSRTPHTLSEETDHGGDEAPEVDPSWVSTLVVPVGFSPPGLVLVLDLAPSLSSAFSKASARPTAPIPCWFRTSDLAGAGESNSGSVPVPVFGNAITSRIDGVLHSIDISLSNPVYRIVFARFLEGSTKRAHEVFRKRAVICRVVGVRSCRGCRRDR